MPYDDVEHRRELDFDRMLASFPSLMAHVRQFTVLLPTSIRSVSRRLACCLRNNRQLYVEGVACYVAHMLFALPSLMAIVRQFTTDNSPFHRQLRHSQYKALYVASPPSVDQWGTVRWRSYALM